MAMDPSRFTEKLQEALGRAQNAALTAHNQAVDVEHLLAEQRENSETAQRLTALRYEARGLAAAADDGGFAEARLAALSEYTEAREEMKSIDVQLKEALAKRARIDDERVRVLTQDLADVDTKLSEGALELGRIDERVARLTEELDQRNRELATVLKKHADNQDLTIKRDVAAELLARDAGMLAACVLGQSRRPFGRGLRLGCLKPQPYARGEEDLPSQSKFRPDQVLSQIFD